MQATNNTFYTGRDSIPYLAFNKLKKQMVQSHNMLRYVIKAEKNKSFPLPDPIDNHLIVAALILLYESFSNRKLWVNDMVSLYGLNVFLQEEIKRKLFGTSTHVSLKSPFVQAYTRHERLKNKFNPNGMMMYILFDMFLPEYLESLNDRNYTAVENKLDTQKNDLSSLSLVSTYINIDYEKSAAFSPIQHNNINDDDKAMFFKCAEYVLSQMCSSPDSFNMFYNAVNDYHTDISDRIGKLRWSEKNQQPNKLELLNELINDTFLKYKSVDLLRILYEIDVDEFRVINIFGKSEYLQDRVKSMTNNLILYKFLIPNKDSKSAYDEYCVDRNKVEQHLGSILFDNL